MVPDDIEIHKEPDEQYEHPTEDLSLNMAPKAPPPQRQIKHIVISGGSAWGFCALGMLHEAISVGFLHISDIQTMYLTSVGSIIGTMFALGIDADILKIGRAHV